MQTWYHVFNHWQESSFTDRIMKDRGKTSQNVNLRLGGAVKKSTGIANTAGRQNRANFFKFNEGIKALWITSVCPVKYRGLEESPLNKYSMKIQWNSIKINGIQ